MLILIVLWIFLERTRYGIAVRASAFDTDTAGLMGINVNTISIIVFSISGITGGIAGLFFGMKYAVYPTLGGIAIKAFIASVIGGLGSLPGAVLGGLLLGVLETMVAGYISSSYRDLFSFALLILMLLFLPNGLLGKNTKQKS
jgi:branched-chain amino acid transport system permease protein